MYIMANVCFEERVGIMYKNNGDACQSYTVLTVKDRECDVEWIVRDAAQRQLRLANFGNVPEIYVVDLDSNDKTYEILQKLELEYEFLKVLRKDEYITEWVTGEWI